MSKQRINTGTTPSDGTGDNVRAAFDKVNANFDEVYESLEGVATAEDIGNAVANEAAARATAITAEATARAAAISGEASARSAGDATNASAIAAEATARAAAVSTEVANRLAGDATNASAIAAETSARIAADALKADLVGGVIPTAQIPAIAISTYLGNAANQAAMLAFTGQSGDWCNRSDTSTAWVITGADPTQLSSWAQINYPASPVTSVNGQSGVIVLGKADVGLGSVDNTADSAKPVSTAQQTALNLKQDKSSLGADLAAAVHATTNKPTLVDLDEFNINDSAATYTPKKTTFASLKASIRSYLATVFANVIHADNHKAAGADSIRIDEFAVPTDNTNLNATTGRHGLLPKLGGGTTNFLRADGSWAAPPGGGGGGSMVFSSGVLQGYTDPGSPDSPGVGFIYADAWTPTDYGTITFEGSGDSVTYSVAPSDPEDGTTWIDALSCVTGSDLVTAIYNDLTANHLTLLINTYSGATLGVQDGYSSGSASYVNVAVATPNITSSSGSGSDYVEPSGAVSDSIIIVCDAGKKVTPMRIGWFADGTFLVTLDLYLRDPSSGATLPLCSSFNMGDYPTGEASNLGGPAIIGANYYQWILPPVGYDIVASYGDTPPVGGSVTVWVQACQI